MYRTFYKTNTKRGCSEENSDNFILISFIRLFYRFTFIDLLFYTMLIVEESTPKETHEIPRVAIKRRSAEFHRFV